MTLSLYHSPYLFFLTPLMASLILGALHISTPPPHQNLSSKSSISRTETLTLSLSTPSSSFSTSLQPVVPLIYCGRGDKKTARGKRFNHSYGNARPRNKKKGRGPPRVVVPPAPPRKDKYDDGEIIHIDIEESLFSG